MSRFTATSLKVLALALGLGLLGGTSIAQAQTSEDPLQRDDNAAVGGSGDIFNSPFDLFHEAVLSGGTNREQYRESSTEQINEAAAEFRQQGNSGQQPLRFEYEEDFTETESVEVEGN